VAAVIVAQWVGGRKACRHDDARPSTWPIEWAVLKPIGTGRCARAATATWGRREAIGDVLDSAYPHDKAVGFAVGDLRGWMWAEVQKSTGAPNPAAPRRAAQVRGSPCMEDRGGRSPVHFWPPVDVLVALCADDHPCDATRAATR